MKKVLFLVAVFALAAMPALADGHGGFNYNQDVVVVGNINHAGEVENEVDVNANTGFNGAMGNSGNVTIKTGDAGAYAYSFNQVNTNKNVVFDGCGCEEDGPSVYTEKGGPKGPQGRGGDHGGNVDKNYLIVGNYNTADEVENEVDVNANTGFNGAMDNGGEYNEGTTGVVFLYGHRNGGLRGPSSTLMGGLYYNHEVSFPQGGNVNITTGDAGAAADSVNVVNSNVNRVTRGVVNGF